MKSGFEEKLEAFCGEAGLKAAKQLLKRNCLSGAWHDEAGHLHGVFLGERGAVSCTVIPGNTPFPIVPNAGICTASAAALTARRC